MAINATNLFEIILVLLCIVVTITSFIRLIVLGWKVNGFARSFRERIAVIDPEGYKSIFTFWGVPYYGSNQAFLIKKYIAEKGNNADSELSALEKKINAPVNFGLLTVLLIPGGFISAVAVVYLFEIFHKTP